MKFSSLFILPIFFWTNFNSIDLDEVRANYNKLPSDRELCRQMIAELEKTKNTSATHLAYLGGLQAIWANHVFSPISKFNTFREGRKNIEQAINKEPDNAELRFIRLSVQKNVPAFLGYKSNVKEDTEFIKKNRHRMGAIILQKDIEKLLNN